MECRPCYLTSWATVGKRLSPQGPTPASTSFSIKQDGAYLPGIQQAPDA